MSDKNKQLSDNVFATWLEEAKRLRTQEAASTADFFRHIQTGEQNEAMWRGAGYPTFSAILSGEDVCAPSRYENFKAAVARFGWDRVRELGVDQIEVALRIPAEAMSAMDPSTRASDAVLADMTASRVRNHVPVSERQARAIGRKHYQPPALVREMVPDKQRIAELEAEVKSVRKDNARLLKENARLTKALAMATAGSAAAE